MKGRGSPENPTGRFEPLVIEPDPSEENPRPIRTEFFQDHSRSVLSTNNSPDVGFDVSLNPYRGCEHGCSYCYARPTHEYLGMSCGLDFETKILVKAEAPELLREALLRRSWIPQVVALSGVTDPYQPVERQLKITRRCLEVLAEFRNPVAIITKNHLVTRDLDILKELAEHRAVLVNISLTTLDRELSRVMEPRASAPQKRLEAIATLSQSGIPVNVMCAPVIPGLTDHELADLLKAAAQAGAHSANYTLLRLPYGVKDLFLSWLSQHYPHHKQKVEQRLRQMRDGKLNNSAFGRRMSGEGDYATTLAQMFDLFRRRYGLASRTPAMETTAFRRVEAGQGFLF